MLAGELTVRQVTRPLKLAISTAEPAGSGFRATTRIGRDAYGATAAKGMAARHLDITVTAVAEPR